MEQGLRDLSEQVRIIAGITLGREIRDDEVISEVTRELELKSFYE